MLIFNISEILGLSALVLVHLVHLGHHLHHLHLLVRRGVGHVQCSRAIVLVHGGHHLHHLHLLVHLGVGLILALHGLPGLLQCLLTALVLVWFDAAEVDDAGQTAAEYEDANDD